MFKKLFSDKRGQALTEYGLLVAVIAVAIIATVGIFRNKLVDVFKNAGDSLKNQSAVVAPQP